MKVEIYSDIACPWCYIGERRFRRALAAYPGAESVEVVFRSFQLDPTMPEEPAPLMEYLERRFGSSPDAMLAQVDEGARGEGLEMDWGRAIAVNTLTAHRLLRLAEREYGAAVQRVVADKLFAAHFSHGGDVADHDLLTDLAVASGMEEGRVRDYLASGEGLEETRTEIDEARRLGIQAVPTFIFDGAFSVQGAQPASAFLQAFERVTAAAVAAAEADTDTEDSADPCADGGCEV